MVPTGSDNSLAKLLWEQGGSVGPICIVDIWKGEINILRIPCRFFMDENQ
jgi:hypothetical protein